MTAEQRRIATMQKAGALRPALNLLSSNTPERIRTSDLRIRSPSLYPSELRAQGVAVKLVPAWEYGTVKNVVTRCAADGALQLEACPDPQAWL